MASSYRIVWNMDALYRIRTQAQPLVDEHLQRICDRANAMFGADGFRWESHQGAKAPQGRWRGTVFPHTVHAIRSNNKHNTLLRALGGG